MNFECQEKNDVHVVARLRRRIQQAKQLGLVVRVEWLVDEQATWCEIGGVPTLFVDASQAAAEQLRQLDETLATYSSRPPSLVQVASDGGGLHSDQRQRAA